MKILLSRRSINFSLIGFTAFLLSGSGPDYFELNKQLEIFADIYREVHQNYVDEPASSELMEKAIDGMLSSLDPYTSYIPEYRVEDYRAQNAGQYAGIGAGIRSKDSLPAIAWLYEGSAADSAGLMVGDCFEKVEGIDAKGMPIEEVQQLLKGAPGSRISLSIRRGDERFEKQFERVQVNVPSVPHYTEIAPGIGYILLTQFTDRASSEVQQAYQRLKKNGDLKGLILDLRGNPGGLLGEAVNVSNLFLDKGQEVVRTRGKARQARMQYGTQRNPMDREIPLAVLIDGNSASASEIVAGVMQDLDRGIIIGTRSFGKGLVQQTAPISYGAQVKITIAKYHTPSGRCIQSVNYSQKDAFGEPTQVADSLRNSFRTKNGRAVKDGGGIDPDVEVDQENIPVLIESLLEEDILFDFANAQQRTRPDQLIEPDTYLPSDKDLEVFRSYMDDSPFQFLTRTDIVIERLEEMAEREEFGEFKTDIEQLKAQFDLKKGEEFERHKEQIRQELGSQIAMRYGYDRGQVIFNLRFDPVSQRAIELLNDQGAYNALLGKQ
jgi:carboxyl-terminal processing protease